MLLSACLIVKNEELTIRKCLDSLVDVADEIIIVDTGSTDGTIRIAEEYHAKIFSYEWDNNFANARNESLKHAVGDFVLIIDADEFLDPIQKKGLRSFLETTDAEGVFLSLRNYIGSLTRPSTTPDLSLLRVFRRGHFYTGTVHEQIYPSIEAIHGKLEEFSLVLHHMGYLQEFIRTKDKVKRNLELVTQEWELDPESVFNRSNLMAEYLRDRDFRNCVKIGESVLSDLKSKKFAENQMHLVIRSLIYLITSYWQLGEHERGNAVAQEASSIFPQVAEIKKRYADTLLAIGKVREAIDMLMECRRLGEPKATLFDTYSGMGSYLAAADLGLAWLKLGDQSLARKWLLTSFMENPNLEYIIAPLLYLMPREPDFLRAHIENKVTDWLTYANYVEAYSVLGMDKAEDLIERYEDKFGSSIVSDRARMANALPGGWERLSQLVHDGESEERILLLGIFELNSGDFERAERTLIQAGERGELILEVYNQSVRDPSFKFDIVPILRELIAMSAVKLIQTLLKHARDRDEAWVFIKYSPLSHVLSETQWPGHTVLECEENAMHFFRQRRLEEATDWLEKAMHFSPTITKVLIECDLALAHNNIEHVQGVLRNAEEYFPESEVLKNIVRQLGIRTSSSSNQLEMRVLTLSGGAESVNPMDIYRTTAVQTMPLNVQLSQLHERGALLTQLVQELSSAGKVNDMRKYIEELQNILTFLRSSLDHRLEVSKITDRTYEYMYKVTVKWFLQPDSVCEDYEAVLEFWKSWAETWKKVQSN